MADNKIKIWKIYKHTNLINGESYVGHTVQNPQRRWKSNGVGYKGQPKFYNAIVQYGWDNFEHIILSETDNEESAIIIECIFKKWYNTIEKGYNVVLYEGKTGTLEWNPTNDDKLHRSRWISAENNPFYGKTHTLESRQKISDANRGKLHTEEHKQKISNTLKGRILSEEHKNKISIANQGKINNSKLTKQQVLLIWFDPRKSTEIAKSYNVSKRAIQNIKNRTTWTSITNSLVNISK